VRVSKPCSMQSNRPTFSVKCTLIKVCSKRLVLTCNITINLEITPKVRYPKRRDILVRFEVFTAVTMKNGVFWVVTLCGSCNNRHFGGTYRLFHQDDTNR
jgi:hypothetical protein